MRGFVLTTISILLLSCIVVAQNKGAEQITAPLSQNANAPTSLAKSTPISNNPLSLTISNYQSFAPIYQWNTPNSRKITGIALSSDAEKVALISSPYKEQWWLELRESESGILLWEVNLEEKAAYNAVTFSPDGSLIAIGLDHGNVKIWNTADGSLAQTLTGHVYSVRIVAFSPDGKWIASGASDNTARIWQVTTGMAKSAYQIKTDVRDIAWSADS